MYIFQFSIILLRHPIYLKNTEVTVKVAFEITIVQVSFTLRNFLFEVIPSTSLTSYGRNYLIIASRNQIAFK